MPVLSGSRAEMNLRCPECARRVGFIGYLFERAAVSAGSYNNTAINCDLHSGILFDNASPGAWTEIRSVYDNLFDHCNVIIAMIPEPTTFALVGLTGLRLPSSALKWRAPSGSVRTS